jgi:beta-galactosidase
MPTRRQFLKTSASAAASISISSHPAFGSLARLVSSSDLASGNTTRLASGWEFLREPLGGPWEVWHSKEIATWQPIAMPHCFNAYDGCDPDTPAYRGNGWYRTHVAIANPYPSGRTLLHFEGAGQTTTVYVGDTLIGRHTGGYDEFVFDITDALYQLLAPSAADAKSKTQPEGVPVAVLCDNSRDLDRMPSDLSDFTLYGGLYRHVNLVYVPAVSLETVHVRTSLATPNSPAEVEVIASLYNPANTSDSITLSIEIFDSKGASVHTAKQAVAPWTGIKPLTSFTLRAPQLWSPSTPDLYQCHISLTTPDGKYTAHETFGIRHMEWVDHGPFKLNGERLLLRGTHRHEDHAGYAAAMPDDLIEQEMRLIKEMGANFIRLAPYQQSRRVLELCDRLGILVWEEIPWCRGGIRDDVFQEMGRRTLRNMISQHYNHPSILLWGFGQRERLAHRIPRGQPAEDPCLPYRAARPLPPARPLAHDHHPPLRLRPRHPRRLLALHLGRMVQRHLSRVSEIPRDPGASASSICFTPSGEPTATPAGTPKILTKFSPRSPPAMEPMSAVWLISTQAAKPASPKTATGRRPMPAISSTGT